jgi:acetyl-CoA carboxylase biotin carboxyl carrier protein
MTEKQVLDLIAAFSSSGLADLELSLGDDRLCLRRFPRAEPAPAPPPRPEAPLPPALPPRDTRAAQSSAAAMVDGAAGASPGCEIVASPIVATFYRSPGPDAPPFAEPGKRVKTGQALCILEAMKAMNELPAEFDMEIVRILPENGSLVEFGQALFEVRRV